MRQILSKLFIVFLIFNINFQIKSLPAQIAIEQSIEERACYLELVIETFRKNLVRDVCQNIITVEDGYAAIDYILPWFEEDFFSLPILDMPLELLGSTFFQLVVLHKVKNSLLSNNQDLAEYDLSIDCSSRALQLDKEISDFRLDITNRSCGEHFDLSQIVNIINGKNNVYVHELCGLVLRIPYTLSGQLLCSTYILDQMKQSLIIENS